ncbi:coenzyme F420-0:L-glutamate ligase, partial [Thioalkalivibrio sp. HK1]|uniref:coenzyme F420-0:L-glutamate ligase n=1 Tax=Thioalkalivibrio sp. HK1 TaxID=1469245 RepID=UPI00046E9E92
MNKKPSTLALTPLEGIPLVGEGDDPGGLIARAVEEAGIVPVAGDVIAITQKILSKAEGRQVSLADIEPSPPTRALAAELEADPRMVELVLRQSRAIVTYGHGVLITEHESGHVMANAGVDRSNTSANTDETLLLPADADASADALRRDLTRRFGCPVAVVIVDSVGRPFRQGVVGIAIGVAGLPALVDLRGEPDLFGRPLRVTIGGFADQIASAA